MRFDYGVGLRRRPVGRESLNFRREGGCLQEGNPWEKVGRWGRREAEHIYKVCLGLEKGQLIF